MDAGSPLENKRGLIVMRSTNRHMEVAVVTVQSLPEKKRVLRPPGTRGFREPFFCADVANRPLRPAPSRFLYRPRSHSGATRYFASANHGMIGPQSATSCRGAAIRSGITPSVDDEVEQPVVAGARVLSPHLACWLPCFTRLDRRE